MFKIVDRHNLSGKFLNDWFNDSPYIKAHTSGSTGIPKDILLSKYDMLRSAMATCEFFKIDSCSVLLCPLPLDYIAGKMMVVRAIASGATLIVEPPSNDPHTTNIDSIDLLPVVPSQIESLCRSTNRHKIGNLIVGGAPLSGLQKRMLLDWGVNAYQTYGMTETCSHVALAKITESDIVYEALPGITFSTDENDCLRIVAPGFSFSPLSTRDIVRLLDERHFQWRGRLDNVVISGGLKFFPEEVEKLISPFIKEYADITGFYIRGIKSEKWGEELQLVIESEAAVDGETLLSEIKEFLADGKMAPKSVIITRELSRTGSGKIRRL